MFFKFKEINMFLFHWLQSRFIKTSYNELDFFEHVHCGVLIYTVTTVGWNYQITEIIDRLIRLLWLLSPVVLPSSQRIWFLRVTHISNCPPTPHPNFPTLLNPYRRRFPQDTPLQIASFSPPDVFSSLNPGVSGCFFTSIRHFPASSTIHCPLRQASTKIRSVSRQDWSFLHLHLIPIPFSD
jgi:hypothetical protein